MPELDPVVAYDELIRRSRERGLLESCSALLGWDEQTYMPTGGSTHRAEQLALLAGLQHDRATDPRIDTLLGTVAGSELVKAPESPAAVNVRELRRAFERQTKLPKSLVEELARVTSKAQHAWVGARRANDFPAFRPWLERIVELKRQESACLSSGGDMYDPLLDEYEPGATASALTDLFGALRAELVPLVESILAATIRPDVSILRRSYPTERQRVLGEAAASALGFDFQRGRLDVSAHPFCIAIGPGDCRITTRYSEQDFGESFFGVLHETGHALYEQGLDPEHVGTPMGESVSLGVHESQSRLWENAVGRSRAFWRYWYPITRGLFPSALGDVPIDDFYRAINHVEPSLIRVEADEVTYNLHIMIRFDLERALLRGDLPVADLPGAWNAAYERDLGITPSNDANGCLQDIHWSAGLFGYFPTYTLGNLYGAQLFQAADADLDDFDASLTRGEARPLLDWLRERVHHHGRRYRPADLVEHATGQKPDFQPLLAELKQKYGEVYGL